MPSLDDELKKMVLQAVNVDQLLGEAARRLLVHEWSEDDAPIHDLVAELAIAGIIKLPLNLIAFNRLCLQSHPGDRLHQSD